ncbi:anion-transporting ArsA/GET3 family ATPase [Streptosporangium becharense]|uniref:Anion-transporting ArsA/GET3 family ATPase n=1 Tax=Streptosporangium becharense TaxID=1816182 RepID=A0A7W9MH29_9ACTN|nr:ArsA-related P-loop ATPase [Streptosporangium becharense]MBB2908948.1 anion-transporting ArsA/GET3 family ATPase [Streptosporangium becharense]MBB5820034.1 anion-transporting ArsA/GET3 family ATPase [Streptosporangium becharense]
MKARDTDWDGVRLHVVTGKGGTGKTTVAAALALALAAGGRKVLLVEVEGRQGVAQVFDLPPLPYEERKIAVAPGGGDVYALAVDPEEAMLEYLEMFYGMRRAGKALTKMGVVDFATTIAPGFRDVLVTGKTSEAVRRKGKDGRRVYDAVVLDAPPTGRITRFLNVTNEVAGLARVGPIKNHADLVNGVVSSPETAVHFVTLLEEMPVQETLDGLQELREAGLPPGGIFTNMVRESRLPASVLDAAAEDRFDPSELILGLKVAGLTDGGPAAVSVAEALTEEIAEHARRGELERRERATLNTSGRPRYELPLLADGVDLSGLYELAESIRTQGAA